MKTKILACAIVAVLAGCEGAAPTPQASITFAWAYRAGDYIRSVPAVSGGTVIVGADDNALHAVDDDTGESIWLFETPDNVTSSPAILGDAVYFGSGTVPSMHWISTKVSSAGGTKRVGG